MTRNLPNAVGTLGIALAFLLAFEHRLPAQSVDERLDVQGTAAFNQIIFWTGAPRNDGRDNSTRRFSGRIAAAVSRSVFVGLSVGSWQYEIGVNIGFVLPDIDATLYTAVEYTAYGQWYPIRRAGVFLRGGAGMAGTATFRGVGDGEMTVDRHHLAAFTIGGGWDVPIPIRHHLALTLSADYTRLAGDVGAGNAGRAALFIGAGLTIVDRGK